MAETTQYMLAHREVIEALIKKLDLHEGIWQLATEFKLAAVIGGRSEEELMPTAMVSISRFGLQKTEKLTSISLDAAVVNPIEPAKAKATKSTKKKA